VAPSIPTTPPASPPGDRRRFPFVSPRGVLPRPTFPAPALAALTSPGVAGLSGVYALLLLLMLRVPALGLVLAWPLLFFVPGYLLVSRLLPDLAAPGRAGIGVVTSIFVSAHLCFVCAVVAGGMNELAIWLLVAILGAASLALAIVPIRGLEPPAWPSGAAIRFDAAVVAGKLRHHQAVLSLATLGSIVVGGVWLYGVWHLTPGGWVAGGWDWSDLLVHTSIGQSILDGNFPPQVPYYAGAPLLYHWFADFHAAIAVATSGIDLITVFCLVAALMAGVFVIVVSTLAESLTGSRRVGLLAGALALFGGGMGYIRLFLDMAKPGADVFNLISSGSYDNVWSGTGPFFRIASVLGTGFLVHRATTLGLPALVAIVLLVHLSLGRRPVGMLLAGVLAALLAPFHFYLFPATYLIVLLYFVANGGWRQPTWRRDAVLFLAPLVIALPFIVPPLMQQAGNGTFRFVIGWSEAPLGEGPLSVAFFFVTNLGVPLLLAAIAALMPRTPARVFLVLWAAALFLVPNLVVAGAVVFDMNKYFQVMAVALAILAAWAIRNWPRPAVAIVLVLSMLSPGLVAAWHLASNYLAVSVGGEAAAHWIEKNTEPRSVFLTDDFINNPVDLSGRLRLITFTPYIANLGYRPDQRVREVKSAWCDGPDTAAAVMGEYGARYVLYRGGFVDCPGTTTDFDASPLFNQIYNAADIRIWALAVP
jgi:hypothetical protein